MCDYDGEYATSFTATWPRARKPHRCDACKETIPPGTKYRRQGYAFEGSAYTAIHCPRCWAMVKALEDKPGRRGPIDTNLDCGEVWENPPEEVAALAFALPKDFDEQEAAE